MKLNYFNFIENIPLGIILISRDKLILAINSITKKNLEIKSEDYIGKSIYNLQLFLFNKDKIEKLFNKMQYETSYPLTLKSSNHNDYKFRYECKINLLVINNEKIFQILFLDKDNQENNKLAQIFASDQEQISNKSLNQQFLFLENSNDFITVIDDHFKIEYINEKYHKEVMGFTKEDILGRAALSFVYPEDVQKISKLMRKSFRKGVGRAEVRCVDKNGKVIWVEIKGKTFIGRDGKKKALLISRDITKRLEILEKLKESEQKFRTIAQQSFMGIGIIQDNNFKYVNEKFAEITGYDLNVILRWEYNEFIKLIYEKDREFVLDQLKKKQENIKRVVNNYQFRATRKNGSIRWLDLFSKTIHYHGGYADLFAIIDITERKLAEEKLKESEKKYKRLFENMTNGIVLTNVKGTVIEINPVAEKLSGYKRMDIIGQNYTSLGLFNTKHIQQFKKRYIKLCNGVKVHPIEIYTKNKDGKELWLQYESSLIKMDDGDYIEAIIQDITDKVKAEQKLKESEEKFRNIAEQSIISIGILQDNELKYANNHFGKGLGYPLEEFKKWKLNDFINVVHPEDRKLVYGQANNKQSGIGNIIPNYEFRIFKKDGTMQWRSVSSKTITFNQRPANLITLFDITKQKEAEQIIKEENKKLRQLDKMRKEFVNRASHELKTPLTSIHGALQLIKKTQRNNLNEEVNELLNIANKGSNRLKKLVFNLLDISRIEAQKFELEKVEVDLVKLFKENLNDMKYLINERSLSIEVNLPNKMLTYVDQIRIEQVLINLLSNAVKNTPPNGKISITLKKDSNNIIFYVKDTGVGLIESELAIIFNKFSKIERYGQGFNVSAEGSGLGLYISREIIESHGGEIWAESQGRNKGSTFYVKLPIII